MLFIFDTCLTFKLIIVGIWNHGFSRAHIRQLGQFGHWTITNSFWSLTTTTGSVSVAACRTGMFTVWTRKGGLLMVTAVTWYHGDILLWRVFAPKKKISYTKVKECSTIFRSILHSYREGLRFPSTQIKNLFQNKNNKC